MLTSRNGRLVCTFASLCTTHYEAVVCSGCLFSPGFASIRTSVNAAGIVPECPSRRVYHSAKPNLPTDLILRLWTPSPQAGKPPTVLMVQMDQGSILHMYWLHSLWHGTASYTCAHVQTCTQTHAHAHEHTHREKETHMGD